MPLARRIRIIVATLAVALLVPAAAYAQDGAEPQPPAEAAPQKGKKAKARKNKRKQAFPMDGEELMAKVDERLKRWGARLKKRVEKANIPPKAKQQIRADFIKGAKVIRKAAARAAKDGTVTKQEAQKVRQVAKKVRQRFIKKWRRIAAKRRRPAPKD